MSQVWIVSTKKRYVEAEMETNQEFAYKDLHRLMTLMTGDEKHTFSATSTLDVLWVLYDRILRIDPSDPRAPDRDRFLLSKGHGPMAFYAVLAAKGFIPEQMLGSFAEYDSPLGQHPDRTLVPGVEIGSGSLGHGMPIAVGMALALWARGADDPSVHCMVGDAELDEGSNSEAICLAGRRGLSNLTVIAVDNASASHGWPGGIERRFLIEGWAGVRVDGRDHDAIEDAFRTDHPDAPLVIVASVLERG
jgi:transketolase